MTAALKPRTLAGAGWVSPEKLPRGPNGRVLCRWCGVEVPRGKRTFCSGVRAKFTYPTGELLVPGSGCVHEHCLRSDPGYARKCVWARDKGHCALCRMASGGWQADHIMPVAEGGGSCGLENLRTLCTACHLIETRKLAGRLAERRRAQRPVQR